MSYTPEVTNEMTDDEAVTSALLLGMPGVKHTPLGGWFTATEDYCQFELDFITGTRRSDNYMEGRGTWRTRAGLARDYIDWFYSRPPPLPKSPPPPASKSIRIAMQDLVAAGARQYDTSRKDD